MALWLRFGTAELADALGPAVRVDYAAVAPLLRRAVDTAVALWRSGRHACGAATARQRNGRSCEEKAWRMGRSGAVVARPLKRLPR